tara:strand:+ start:59 stop:1744 length:1686 start_codon:yes stop_codon:yes gene_type:complete
MFKSNASNQFISSKSQSVKPDVVSDVKPLDQIRLLIPSFVSFIDPNETYFKCELKINDARGIVVPDKKGGIHSLFRNVILRDGANTATIESLEDYNANACMVRPYTQQDSIHHKRELFEGVQQDANNSGASLYYDSPQSLAGANTAATAQGAERLSKTIQIYCKLRAGFLGGGIVPVAAMNGLRLQIDTEDPLRCLTQPFLGSSEDKGILNATIIQPLAAAGDIGTRVATAASNIGTLKTEIDTTSAGINNPFAVNDIIYINNDGGTAGDYQDEEVAGVVLGFFIEANKLCIKLALQANNNTQVPSSVNYSAGNNSRCYYKMSDRQRVLNTIGENNVTNVADTTIPVVSYTISAIEMLCSAVQPPPAYVEGMLKKAMSDGGLQMDYMTHELHRFNQVNTQGIVQIQIPTLATRAKSIMCQPIPNANFRNLAISSFSGAPDNARNYQFIKGTELIPSRVADLERYSQAVGTTTSRRNEPLHTSELQKALVNIGSSVYSLQRIFDNFVIARSLNKYGQITDLSNDSVSLRVDYDTGGSQKIFNNYVYKLARLNISRGVVSVVS